jgi:hypothetical protein
VSLLGRMIKFRGGSVTVAVESEQFVYGFALGEATSLGAQIVYKSDGTIETASSLGSGPAGGYVVGFPIADAGAGLVARLQYGSGDVIFTPGSTLLNEWYPLTVNRTWAFSAFLNQFESRAGTYVISISDDGGSSVTAQTTWNISFTHDGPVGP